jgi:hypothetical protein
MAITLMIFGACLFFGGAIWLGLQTEAALTPINPLTTPVRHRFDTFSSDGNIEVEKYFEGIDRRTGKELFRFNYTVRLYNNLRSHSSYISFYIPNTPHTVEFCVFLASNWKKIADELQAQIKITMSGNGMVQPLELNNGIITGQVYIFYEGVITMRQVVELTDLFKQNGADVDFRGPIP